MEKQQDLLDKKSIELREAQIQKGSEAMAASAATFAVVNMFQERYDQTYYDTKADKAELANIRDESSSAIKELSAEKDSIKQAIVTEEEFYQVQKIMDTKSRKMKNLNTGKHKVGYKPHSTAYGRLMICQCGNKFNQRCHTRDGRTDGVDYQCYTSVNQGSIREREKRGLSVEGHCDSPFIQGWKLEMMAEKIFERYIDNADTVMELSYSMLEKHIADQEDTPDYTEEIKRKESEIERLSKKRINLIEMRAEGDIDKELFRERKQEIEKQIADLTEEIKTLQPDEAKQSPQDYVKKLQELRERLKEYTGFDYSVIPESVVEAFIEKIWVSKDEFRWYLRSGKGSPDEFDLDDHIQIASFTLTIDDAKKYLYSFSTRRRVYNWKDLNVSVWI